MTAMIKTEFLKMKRYHILLIGVIGMFCSPLLQLFSQSIMIEEAKNPHFNMAALLEDTVWGNATVFMPVILTLIGGYLINREYTDDTLKNVLTVPLSFRRFLTGKFLTIGLLAAFFGVYCFAATVIVGVCAGLPELDFFVLLKGLWQMVGIALGVYIVILPVLAVCSRKPGGFMGGAVVSFILGYCCMFFKQGLLRNIYPFSAALTLIGFDTGSYAGTSGKGSIPLAILSLGIMTGAAALLTVIAKAPRDTHREKKAKGKAGSRHTARKKR